jgi:pyruvate/2-oxoglutarate dehydrogenase complex dihydrolipoamide dehydrogenase (E3) component
MSTTATTNIEDFDAIIIGTGQAGKPLATALSGAGWKTAILERGDVGGTCINTGCTPTKTMVSSARRAWLARTAAPYGVDTGKVKVNMNRVRERKREIVLSFRDGNEKRLSGNPKLELIRGEGVFIAPNEVAVAGRHLRAIKIFVNTGARPAVPPLPGLETVPWLDNARIMELDTIPEHLLVLGGGYIGCEFSQMFRRFGSRVTILTSALQLLPREDADIAEALRKIFEEDGITMHFGTKVERVDKNGDKIALSGDGKTIEGSHLLVGVGRTPNTEGLGLEKAGVELDKHGYIKVNERLETNIAGIYALGDVNGGPQFTHIAYDDYRVIQRNLLGDKKGTTRGRMVPYTVYTDPQLGRVGMTEQEARAAGKKIKIACMAGTSIARGLETGETRGLLKVIVDADSDQILGAAMFSPEGGELAAMIQLATMGGVTASTIHDAIFAHPTWAESLNNLMGGLKDA